MIISDTFANLPRVCLEDLNSEYNCIIVGIEYGGKSSFRVGAKFGPRKIRECGFVNQHSFEYGLNILDYLNIADAGNIPIAPCDTENNINDTIFRYVTSVVERISYPIFLGGDRSVTYAELKAFHHLSGPVSVVFFGAHSGLCDNPYGNELSVVRKCIDERLIDCASSAIIGVREMFVPKSDSDYAKKHSLLLVSVEEIVNKGINHISHIIKERMTGKKVFVANCIDVAEIDCAPGVSAPIPNGLSSFELFELMKSCLTGQRLLGCDITGCLGGMDLTKRTERFAAGLVNEMISVFASCEAGIKEYSIGDY